MEKGKKVGVLFSGGLDSTFLIWKNLKDGNTVVPFYFEIENNQKKPMLEKNRIELLYNEFNKEFDGKIEPIKYVLKILVTDFSNNLFFKQIPIWILGMLFSDQKGLSEIQFGYVMNDDAISYLDDIKKIYKSYSTITDTLVPITFPLRKWKKCAILEDLPENYRNLVVSCENPILIGNEDAEILKYKPCGHCVPCQHILDSDNYNSSLSDDYKKQKLDQAMQVINSLGKAETKQENGRFYHMIEMDDPMKADPEPCQMEINFDEIEEYEYKKKENG